MVLLFKFSRVLLIKFICFLINKFIRFINSKYSFDLFTCFALINLFVFTIQIIHLMDQIYSSLLINVIRLFQYILFVFIKYSSSFVLKNKKNRFIGFLNHVYSCFSMKFICSNGLISCAFINQCYLFVWSQIYLF